MTQSDKAKAYVNDVMKTITETVIAAIESGTAPWQQPWENRQQYSAPTNLSTGKPYHGLNAIFLHMLGAHMGSSYWVGFKQAKQMGGHVRKGEKGTAILRPLTKKYEDDNGENRFYVYGFAVVKIWNVCQCDGIELPTIDAPETTRTLDADRLDAFARNTGARIEHGGDVACYIPSQDLVRMPEKDQFTSEGGYYGTLLHELTHWTRHESRLNRTKENSKHGYAFEELIAELGAFYASEALDCPNEAENHASYLESWLKALKNDPKYLWSAAAKAQKAADYLIALHDKALQAKAA